MPDFSKYLEVDVASVEAPRPVPVGHYFAVVNSYKTTEVEYQRGTKTPVVEITFKITGADDDVDHDQLPEGGGQGKLVTRNYTLNDPDKAGIYALRRLAEETCDLPVKGLSLGDVLDQLKGQDVKLYIEHRAGSEEGQFFPRVAKVLSARG